MPPGRAYRNIFSRDVPALLQQGVAIVDIRREAEWTLTGTVSGSHLLTFFDEDGHSRPESWVSELDRLVPPDRPLILLCRTGHRTGLICEYLIETTTRTDIYNVCDGIFGWLAGGLPVDRYPSA